MSSSFEKKLFDAIKHGQKEPKSTYDIWLEAGYTGTPEEFLEFLKGATGDAGPEGDSAFEVWKSIEGNEDKTEEDFLLAIKGDPGQDAKSNYDIWIELGNEGTPDDFLEFLKGEQGEQGIQGPQGNPGLDAKSNYDIWIELGNDGTPDEFLEFLKGEPGTQATVVNGVTVPASAWTAYNGIYKATISNEVITANDVVNVNFTEDSIQNAISNGVLGYTNSIAGGFEIFSNFQPTVDLVIDYAIITN